MSSAGDGGDRGSSRPGLRKGVEDTGTGSDIESGPRFGDRDIRAWSPPPLDDDAREAAGMLETVAAARRAWKRKLTERLNQISSRTGIPLAYSERRAGGGERNGAANDGGARGAKKSAVSGAAADLPGEQGMCGKTQNPNYKPKS